MKPFDLEKALNGEPIYNPVTNEKVWVIGKSKTNENWAIVEKKGCEAEVISIDYLAQCFRMCQAPRPRVQLDLPAPLKTAVHNQEVFKFKNGKVGKFPFNAKSAKHQSHLAVGCLFASAQDAQEWLDAMRGARR